jgi:putative ABC transport system permease protein
MLLFSRIILRHFRGEWGKLLLSVVGVAIGVAVFVAIRLANTTAFEAFSSSLDAVAGRANLQVVASDGRGFDEGLIEKLRETAAVEAAAPVIEQYAQIVDSAELADPGTGSPLLVFGIDVFTEGKLRSYEFDESSMPSDDAASLEFLLRPNAIIITSKTSRALHIGIGDSLNLIAAGRRIAFGVVGIIEPEGTASALGGSFALLDIASAQETFGRVGRLDRIDLVVPERESPRIAEYLSTLVPAGVTVEAPSRRNEQTLRMLDAFELNLTALGFIALFVSMFIIYNTMLTSTLRRRRELGILRAVGATRGTIVSLFLGEAAVIGLLGVAIGLPLGITLARLALDQVVQTVTALYILTVAEQLTIDVGTLVLGGVIGLAASVLSALPPALEAAKVHPRETFSVQSFESGVSRRYRLIVTASIVTLLAAWIASLQGEALNSPLLGFAGAGLVLVGFALLTPLVLRASDRLLGRGLKRLVGVEGELANAYLMQSLGRASTAIAALMTAIAMLVGISTMVGSFRSTVELWMRQTINADLYLTIANNRLASSAAVAMPEEIIRHLDSLPEASHVDALRRLRTSYQGRTITVNGARLTIPAEDASLTFQEGTFDGVLAALDTGAIAVSEAFAIRFDKRSGDTIVLSTPTGSHPLTIAGVYYDYTTDAGAVMMRRATFIRLYADSAVGNAALYLKDPSQHERVRDAIERRFAARYSLIVYSNRSLRDEVLKIFDQTFAITYALQIVAIIVAAIGVANTLAALVVERSREIGILKAIGASAQQVRNMTLVQAGLIGLTSQILGSIAGLLLSAILIYVINRVSFGWTIQFELSPGILGISTLLVMATAFLAGIIPANRAAGRAVADVVRAE